MKNNNNEMSFAVGTIESGLYEYFKTKTEAYEFYLQEVERANEQNAQFLEEMGREDYDSFMKDTLAPCDFIFYRELTADDFENSDADEGCAEDENDDSDEELIYAAVIDNNERASKVIGYILNARADLKSIAIASKFTSDDHPFEISVHKVSHSRSNIKKAQYTQPVSLHKSGVYTFGFVAN